MCLTTVTKIYDPPKKGPVYAYKYFREGLKGLHYTTTKEYIPGKTYEVKSKRIIGAWGLKYETGYHAYKNQNSENGYIERRVKLEDIVATGNQSWFEAEPAYVAKKMTIIPSEGEKGYDKYYKEEKYGKNNGKEKSSSTTTRTRKPVSKGKAKSAGKGGKTGGRKV